MNIDDVEVCRDVGRWFRTEASLSAVNRMFRVVASSLFGRLYPWHGWSMLFEYDIITIYNQDQIQLFVHALMSYAIY